MEAGGATVSILSGLRFWDHARRNDPLTEASCVIVAAVFVSYATIVGSYIVTAGGQTFRIACPAPRHRYKPGQVVPFAHRGWTRKGLPMRPRFL